MPLRTFGQEIGLTQIDQLGEGLPAFIDKLIYDPLSDDSKIEAIYSPMLVMSNEKKEMMRHFVQQYRVKQNKRVHERIRDDLKKGLYTEDSPDLFDAWSLYIQQEMSDGGLREHLQMVLNEYWTKVPFEEINANDFVTRLSPLIIVESKDQLNDL